MKTEGSSEFNKLTFSQREGKIPLPEPMQLKEVSPKFRQLIWHCIGTNSGGFINAHEMIYSYRFDILNEPHDEIVSHDEYENYEDISFSDTSVGSFAKDTILNGEYHEILTMIEFFLRHEGCTSIFRNSLEKIFESTKIAYFIKDIDELPTITPRITRESGEAVQQAIETIDMSGMAGASTHLRQAAENINANRYAKSIEDSIHAVESVARTIDPKAKTLGPALDSLQKSGLLKHPALKEAFSKLYGYTSDEQGIRHALLDKGSPDVDLDEAMFMFGACASFAAYLVNKHRKAAQTQGSGQ